MTQSKSLHRAALAAVVLLTVFSSPAQTTSPINAVSCDGIDDHVTVAATNWFSGNFTIEGWVYVRSYNNWSRLVDFGSGPNAQEVYLALSSGTSGKPAMGVLNGSGNVIISAAQ